MRDRIGEEGAAEKVCCVMIPGHICSIDNITPWQSGKVRFLPRKLELYEKLLATRPDIGRKGDVHPYTSLNGHMFTYLDQTGVMGIRLPHAELEAFLKKYETTLFVSYGAVKKDWATVPDALLKKTKDLAKYLDISYAYTGTLKPK